MRIDSGVGSHYYQSRYQHDTGDAEETAAEPVAGPRRSGNPAFSSTLLSSNLASALWVIEGGRKDTPANGTAVSRSKPDEAHIRNTAEQVEALYMEFDGEE